MLSDRQPIAEISATELGRGVSSALERVGAGERLIVTRHGSPVAILVSLDTGFDLMLAGSERFTLLRREAHEDLEAGVAEALATWRTTGSS